MGGSESIEFIQRSDAGEDWVVTCESCDYRANIERAVSALDPIVDGEPTELERFSTPGLRTIKALAEAHPDISAPDRQIKSLVYVVDGEPVLVLLRGDHGLQEQKLLDATGAPEDGARPAQPDEIRDLLGADPGSLGGVGVTDITIVADRALEGRSNMTTGANEDDWHYKGVDVGRDIGVTRWADLREVTGGERCVNDGGTLEMWKGVEVGHIFKLGTMYSEAFGAYVQDEAGSSHPIIMGSYGIGLERGMAAVVEASHDESGIVWPLSVAPYELVITVIRPDDEPTMALANRLYDDFDSAGVDVLLDDRDERPGVKFADSELIGIPFRLVVGPKGVESGIAEVTERRGMVKSELPFDEVVATLSERVAGARFGI
jgi:prolyl-tRNA synthetase